MAESQSSRRKPRRGEGRRKGEKPRPPAGDAVEARERARPPRDQASSAEVASAATVDPEGEPKVPVTTVAQVVFALLAGLAVYSFVLMARHAESRRACDALVQLRPQYLGADRTAPDFDLEDGKGGRVKLSSYRGKVVVLHFWTKTCAPCLDELPRLQSFALTLKGRTDVAVIAVTIDDGPEAIKDVMAATFLDGPPAFVMAYDRQNETVSGRYGTKLFPETWLIDPQGVIRARFDGEPHAGEGCESAWKGSLLLSAIDSILGPTKCDIVLDPKVDPNPEHRLAQCHHE